MKLSIKTTILLICAMIMGLKLPAQELKTETFTNPKKYGWDNFEERYEYRKDLNSRKELLQLYELNAKTPSSTMIKSAIFPGWGHYSIEAYTKGHIFMTGGVALIGTGLYFYSRSQDYYQKYKDANQIDEIRSNFDKAEDNYQTAIIFLASYALLWGYNLYDSTVSTQDYNANIWEKILNSRFEKVSITPIGIQVRF